MRRGRTYNIAFIHLIYDNIITLIPFASKQAPGRSAERL